MVALHAIFEIIIIMSKSHAPAVPPDKVTCTPVYLQRACQVDLMKIKIVSHSEHVTQQSVSVTQSAQLFTVCLPNR